MRSGSLCVVWFDPGGSTGWAAYQTDIIVHSYGKYSFGPEQIIQGQLGPEPHHFALWDLLGRLHAANYIIGMESFEYWQDQREKVVLVSKEYIGVAKLYVADRNKTLPGEAQVGYLEQDPATGKGFWYPKVKGKKNARDGSKLKTVGLHSPTTNGHHINDATAHLLHWLTWGPLKRQRWLLQLKEA
jgi:hypothetical protein